MDGFRSNLSEKYGHKSHKTDGVIASLIPMHSTDKNIAFALNENCDPTVRSDMNQGLDRIVDEKVKLHDVICNSITFPSSSRDLGQC